MKQIILSSTSPRRKQLLEQVGLACKIVPSNYEEKLNPRLKPKGQAEFLSKAKAKAVAEKFAGQEVIVLGFDKQIDIQGETLGKPKTVGEAKRMLQRLSGKVHTAITAFTIIDTMSSRTVTKAVETKIWVKKLTKKEIESYISSGESIDTGRVYTIEGRGGVFITKVEGDYFNVIGLPLHAVVEELKRFGLSIW